MEILGSFGSPLSDLVSFPFKAYSSMPVDPYSMKLIGFLPIIAFSALLIAAIWRQAKKYPVKFTNTSEFNNLIEPELENLVDS